MKPTNLLIAAVLLAALSGAVWWAKKHPESSETKTASTTASPKILEIPDNQVKQIELTKKDGSAVVLARQSGKWAITSPESLPADQDSVNTLVSALSPVTADSVVEDKPADVSAYGFSKPSLTVTVTRQNGKTDRVTFGDDVPAGSLVYAQHASDPKVYAVSTSVRTSFDKGLNDVRDKRLLTFDSNKLTRLELASAKAKLEFAKNNQNDWQIVKPKPYRADSFQVEELLRKLSDAKMDLLGGDTETKKSEAFFASGKPVGSAKATDANGTQTLDVRKNKDDYFARSSAVKGTYKLGADLGKELEKSVDDFRNKKLFDFGFSDPTKIDVQQNAASKTYQKSGPDWKLNGKIVDPASIQSFIDKLRDLTAVKFVESGFTSPLFEVGVTSNEGKRSEKVSISKGADGYIARRENEPSLYQLDAKAADDILKAGSDIKDAAPAAKK